MDSVGQFDAVVRSWGHVAAARAEAGGTSLLRRAGQMVVASKRAASRAVALLATLLILDASAADSIARGVLIIHSGQRVQPATVIVGDALESVLQKTLGSSVYLFREYLDNEWVSTEAYAATQAEFLRQKYSARNIRVIVVEAYAALQFAVKFRDHMFPGVPVVHVAIGIDQVEGLSLPADFVGKPVDLDPTQTLRFAIRLQPRAERIVIVTGAAPRDRIWEQRLRKAVAHMEEHPEVEYLTGLPTAAVLQRLGALSRDTIVFTPGYLLDGVGRVSTPRQSAELIGSASAAPAYGPFDTFLGTGMVGGYVAPFYDQGTQAGALVVRLLNGTPPTAIAPSSFANVPVVDWRALRRWRIDENLLPANADVRFREPTAWDRYGLQIAIGIAVLIIQALLIAMLIVQRRQRRIAEIQVQHQRTELAHASRLATLGELSASIAHELNQPLAAILGNAEAAQKMLSREKTDLQELRAICSDIVSEDHRARDVIRRVRTLAGKEPPVIVPLDARSVINEVVRLVSADAVLRQIRVSVEIAPDLPPVLGDRIELQQVVLNLLVNAFDAMNHCTTDEREVRVSAVLDGEGTVKVAVRDRGTGVNAGELERIFEPFHTTKRHGLGIGLSISRTIIAVHGGRLWAENNPDRGTSFCFTVPVAKAPLT